jgi:hypothetical protein
MKAGNANKKKNKKIYTTNNVVAKKKNATIILHLKSEFVAESDKTGKAKGSLEDIECLYTSRINTRLNEDKDIINKLSSNDIGDIDEIMKNMTIDEQDLDKPKDNNKNIHVILPEMQEWGVTDKNCWNCAHAFDSTPIGIPVCIKKDGSLKVRGIFCGFPCLLRYIKDRKLFGCKPNIAYLYKILTGNTKLPPEAPVTCALKSFGGHLNIEEYRKGNEKTFNYIKYPMYIVKDYIHEDEINNIKQYNDFLFK